MKDTIAYIFNAVLCLSIFMLASCGQMEPKEKPVKTYKDYTFKEFKKLPHDVQYSLKYPDDVDTIITVEYGWVDTIYTEDGTPSSISTVIRNTNLVLSKDSMKFYYPYQSSPELRIYTMNKIYDKRYDDFADRFVFKFKPSSSKDFYYIEKSEFPDGLCTSASFEKNPSIANIFPTGFEYIRLVGEIEKYHELTCYTFSESHYQESLHVDTYWECEENEITKFKNWLRR